jgi:hypothetical protein
MDARRAKLERLRRQATYHEYRLLEVRRMIDEIQRAISEGHPPEEEEEYVTEDDEEAPPVQRRLPIYAEAAQAAAAAETRSAAMYAAHNVYAKRARETREKEREEQRTRTIAFLHAHKDEIQDYLVNYPRQYEDHPLPVQVTSRGTPLVSERSNIHKGVYGMNRRINGQTYPVFTLNMNNMRLTNKLTGIPSSALEFRDPRDASDVLGHLNMMYEQYVRDHPV